MEEYKRTVTSVCVPYALKKSRITGTVKDIRRVLDSVDRLDNMRVPTRVCLENRLNSCAIDSVLAALFSHFKLTDYSGNNSKIAKISEWLQNIENQSDISTLAPLFKPFPHEDDFYLLGKQKDAAEFLMYLLRIFSDAITGVKIFKTVDLKGNVTCARVDKTSSPVQYISAVDLSKKQNVTVQDLIDLKTNVRDKLAREELVSGDIVVFACGRLTNDGLVTTRVVASPSLTTPNGDRFFLGSIVVYDNGHYISYIRDIYDWYIYDDLSPQVRQRLSYDDMMSGKSGPDPSTRGVLYFYFSDYSSDREYTLSKTKTNELRLGVFKNKLTPKLSLLSNRFDSVRVTSDLYNLLPLQKTGPVDGLTLIISDVTDFLKGL